MRLLKTQWPMEKVNIIAGQKGVICKKDYCSGRVVKCEVLTDKE